MKKIVSIVGIMIVALAFVGVTQAHAMVFTAAELALFGAIQPLPIAPPVTIDVKDAGGNLQTRGQVDFAVLLNAGVYSYFYQVTNIDGGLAVALSRFSLANPLLYPVLGSGQMADGLDPVVLTTAILTNIGANLDPAGNLLQAVGPTPITTNRFYFQFAGPPGLVSGGLQDGGCVGSKMVVGPVPEPTSLLLLGSGLLGTALLGVRKKRKV